jgi:hypothetical protein
MAIDSFQVLAREYPHDAYICGQAAVGLEQRSRLRPLPYDDFKFEVGQRAAVIGESKAASLVSPWPALLLPRYYATVFFNFVMSHTFRWRWTRRNGRHSFT